MTYPNCPAHGGADLPVIHGVDGTTKAKYNRYGAVGKPHDDTEDRHAG